ncbi:MAG: hypothetical protein J0L58_04630 [Burkholderiales bacterium]|nr:hypothetical protein [Burkholderiales bacterium]
MSGIPTTRLPVTLALGALLLPGAGAAQVTQVAPGQIPAGWLLAGLLSGMAMMLGMLALSHRWERRLLLVAVASMSLAGLLTVEQASTPTSLGLLLLLGLSMLILLARQVGLRMRRLDVGATTLLALAWLIASFGPGSLSQRLETALPGALGVGLLALAAYFLWQRWRGWMRDGLNSWAEVGEQVQITVLPLLVATSVGGMLLNGAVRARPPLSVGLLMALLALALVIGFGRRRHHSEQRLRQAEQHFQERMVELERHHQHQADLRLEQVTERERKRIAGDLHDDLGAKLLTIVHTSDNERISTLAREALEEMRLSVRGLTGRPVQLLDAIGDWRAEVVSRLTQSNVEAEWISLAEDVSHTLPARAYVQTTRILREAVSNVIKHSGATRCVVRCQLADGDFQLIIQDNGKGVPTEKDGRLDRGHGMSSMKSRAKQMQGQCLVESGPGWGTLIRLNIPL